MTIFEQLTTDGRFEKMTATGPRHIATTVSPVMDRALRAEAERRECSVASIVRDALYAWLRDNS